MLLRSRVRTIAVPLVPIPATGTGSASIPDPASAASRTSRPGKAVPNQTGAAASPPAGNGSTGAGRGAELTVAVHRGPVS